MAQVTKVEVPDIGDFDDIPVIEILVEIGDTVSIEDPLVTLESDKATMDVPSPVAGRVASIDVKIGDTVKEGSLILTVEEGEAAPSNTEDDLGVAPAQELPDHVEVPDAPPADLGGAPAPPAASPAPAAPAAPPGAPVYASPMVRRRARELGIDLTSVTGTGRGGRIQASDLRAAADTAKPIVPGGVPAGDATSILGFPLAPWPTPDFAKQGPVERVELTRIQKLSAANLHRNWVAIPHVTHNDEADITDLEAFRKEINAEQAKQGEAGAKVTMVALLLKACVASLKAYPRLNSSLDGDGLILKRYYHLGFAADTPNGLVVPVIRDVDQKGILNVARELTELSGKARAGKLGPKEMTGSTFTISSLGGIGGTSFSPIVNAPEVAILGVTRSAMKPVWDGSAFQPRLMVPLSLSYDHRVIDGALAARFVVHLCQTLTDLRRVLL
ncbi:dihydrolipoyllysine-residue acetyltransferase [Paraconexibacter antarcticus]|uniref:Acetyltransferase component of pyruvate dehydrogenase complex n=1 Tax=Paraconexibacter antarcticus TaxID=2949664 RepID=A0ABY5DUX8_9ACTN|nr:dihydrolipoyllysine-residue acetyltransferase [Paraconexibacter antarcticus]UTI65486.1 dihydrolipoyllysine-residue acetyltransferase [Paraconexibacter antarcticus]